MVVLWTDALIYVLLAVIAGYALHTRRHAHLTAPWRRLARSRIGMAMVPILLAYLSVGLLDSLHFQPRAGDATADFQSTEVISAFDLLARPLRVQVEKTYSAPFATRLYVRETRTREDGTQVREAAPLRYGGAHLADASDRWPDIAARGLAAVGAALFCCAGLAVLLAWRLAARGGKTFATALRRLAAGGYTVPWRTILLAAAPLLVLIWAIVLLGGKYHVLGTDKVGQDVLYIALKSIRTGLVIGTLTTLVMLPFALVLGVMAGYFGGRIDDVIQYVYTTLNSIPGVLLIAASILMVQVYMAAHTADFESLAVRADMRLFFLCLILGITSWTGLCRLLRGETLKLRDVEYIQAAQAFGVSHAGIIARHILPNLMHIVLITVVLDFSGLVLAEAVLSYVNIGVDPSTNSWGNMINSARLELAREPVVWWSLCAAFAFMFTLVLAVNLFADAVRDAFDPKIV